MFIEHIEGINKSFLLKNLMPNPYLNKLSQNLWWWALASVFKKKQTKTPQVIIIHGQEREPLWDRAKCIGGAHRLWNQTDYLLYDNHEITISKPRIPQLLNRGHM